MACLSVDDIFDRYERLYPVALELLLGHLSDDGNTNKQYCLQAGLSKHSSERWMLMAHLAVVVLIEFIPHFVEHFSHVWRLPDFHLCDRIHVRLQQLLKLLDKHIRLFLVQEARVICVCQEARVSCVCHGAAMCSSNL